jgi:hypothetical protein
VTTYQDVTPGTAFALSPPNRGGTGWSKVTIHTFQGAESYGPASGLSTDKSGKLFGLAWVGFPVSATEVFMLSPPSAGPSGWTETVLQQEQGGSSAGPAAITVGTHDDLYGVTLDSGAGCPSQQTCPEIYRLTRPADGATQWRQTILYRFTNLAALPHLAGGLVLEANGTIVGEALPFPGIDCARSPGACFTYALTPPGKGRSGWSEAVLHGLPLGGASPVGGLAADGKGNLFGVGAVPFGGEGAAVVFELSPPVAGQTQWSLKILHRFESPQDSTPNSGLALDAAGNVYGSTQTVVYRLSP